MQNDPPALLFDLLPLLEWVLSAALSSRSWRAQLLSLNESVRGWEPEVSCCAPWFQSALRLESLESADHTPTVPTHVFIPGDVPRGRCAFPQKEHVKSSDPGRPWKTMHLSEHEQPTELMCLSVTGFTALFTWAVGATSCTIGLWDLETQSMQCFSLSQKCTPVDIGGDQQLCLALTGEQAVSDGRTLRRGVTAL